MKRRSWSVVRKEKLARCGKCKKAFYCNGKCQKEDWAMHKLECSAMIAFRENWCPSEICRLVARILAKKNIMKERCASENILLIEEMQSHVEDVDNEKREMHEADVARLHRFFPKHLEFPDHKDLLRLFAQVACNGFTIEDDELSNIGTAIYPDVALINHSCCPSVIVTNNGTSAEVRAVQNMKPGDEDKEKLKVRKQSDPIEPEVISNMVRYARKTIGDELLEMCELSLEEMGAVFDDANVYMLHVMYQAMGVCLYMQDADATLRYGEKIVKHYRKLYPSYSLNVSSMYLKLGRLYMGLERRSPGVSALKKAMAIMEVAYGKDHHYLTELCKEMAQQ
ncbi:N-lysine methyltransferase SMYD2 [Liparis tanakae]|uniref:[histone H3]-lysine(4) N-trimethyltransferase n=1 Tax=Liparis tanakae TaxID=230148 RepID=A0A4Z2HSC4_9TELE|nr:N-lysine methyltransferase SMYD2 [Liparis tanakae]